jgi:hypothetical protein
MLLLIILVLTYLIVKNWLNLFNALIAIQIIIIMISISIFLAARLRTLGLAFNRVSFELIAITSLLAIRILVLLSNILKHLLMFFY